MKKLKYYVISFVLFAALILVLLNNRAQLEAKAKNDKISAYPVTVSTAEQKEVSKSIELVGTIVELPPKTMTGALSGFKCVSSMLA